MFLKRVIIALVIALSPTFVFAAGADLKIDASDIRFSKPQLIAGDKVRIYAKIYNVGDVDVSGYIVLYQGSNPISDGQVLSVIVGGAPEEVYVDFIVPSSTFNIRADVRSTDPVDVNMSNNTAVTTVFTPIFDDDRDGVANEKDNCPAIVNPNQLNTDADSMGDACDDDRDNDGLTNDVEIELGTNPLHKDTDGDGVNDPNDAYPTDSKRSVIEKKPLVQSTPVLVPKPTPVPVVAEYKPNSFAAENNKSGSLVTAPVSTKSTEGAQKNSEVPTEVVSATENKTSSVNNSDVAFSPNAVFRVTQISWNTHLFEVSNLGEGTVMYEWDFGDSVRSGKPSVEHTYERSGTYVVTLKSTDADGMVKTESTTVRVPLFSLENRLVLLAIISLVTLLLLACISLLVIRRLEKKLLPNPHVPKHKPEHVKHIEVVEEE